MFRRSNYRDLLPKQKRILISTMVENAVNLYKRYVNEERLKKRRKRHTNRALAPYFEERFLKHRFNRIKSLGNVETDAPSETNCSATTVIEVPKNTTSPLIEQQNENKDISKSEFNSPFENSFDDEDEFESCESFVDEDSRDKMQNITTHNESVFTPKRNLKPFTDSPKSSRPEYNTTIPRSIISVRTNLFDNEPEISVDDILPDNNLDHYEFQISSETLLSTTRTHTIEKYNISDDSDDDSVLIIEERFNDIQTETLEIETVAIAQQSNDCINLVEFATPRIDPSEFLPINAINIRKLSASLDESLELMFNSN